MIKTENNYKKYSLFILVSMLIPVPFLYFFLKPTLFYSTVPMLLLSWLVFVAVNFFQSKKNKKLAFSDDGLLVIQNAHRLDEISWSDLRCELIGNRTFHNEMRLRFSSLKNPNKFFVLSVNWFNEDSLLKVFENYASRNEQFHAALSSYFLNK